MKVPEAKSIIALVVFSFDLFEIIGNNELNMLVRDSTDVSPVVSGDSPNAASKDSLIYSEIKVFVSISSERSTPLADAVSYLSKIFW